MEDLESCWRKSSYSGNGGECVEVGQSAEDVHVRDTKRHDGAELQFSLSAWRKFVASVKR